MAATASRDGVSPAATTDRAASIAVVGGGISGLAAAHRLAELAPNARVTLFEASPRAGGVLETERVDGFQIELGSDSFITNRRGAVELCRRVGLADELIRTNDEHRRTFVVCRGRLQPVPDGFLLMAPSQFRAVLTTPILSWAGKARLAWELFAPRKKVAGDESLESFATRRLGRETFERLVQPLIGGIYTADPAKLSLAATLPRFLEMERKYGSVTRGLLAEEAQKRRAARSAGKKLDGEKSGARYSLFVTPKRGLSSLVEAILARLPAECVRFETPVDRVAKSPDGGWRVHARSGDRETVERFDAVVVAAPAPIASRILRDAAPDAAAEMAEIPYAGAAVVSLGYRDSQLTRPLEGFGYVAPEIEKRRVIACSFSSVKFAGRAPEGTQLFRAFVGGALHREWIDQSDAELVAVARRELEELLGVRGEPIVTRVARYDGKMPQYHVGHRDRVERIEAAIATRDGLAVCGNAYRGVGIPDCVVNAESAAERIVARLAATGPSDAAAGA